MISHPYIDILYEGEEWLVEKDKRTSTISIGHYNKNIQAYFVCGTIINKSKINFQTNYSIDSLPENVRDVIIEEII